MVVTILFVLWVFIVAMNFVGALFAIVIPFKPYTSRKDAMKTSAGTVFVMFISMIVGAFILPKESERVAGVSETELKKSILTESSESSSNSTNPEEMQTQNEASTSRCENKYSEANKYIVNADSLDLRTAPDSDVIANEKASKALGKPFARQAMRGSVVVELCRHDGWSKIDLSQYSIPKKERRGWVETEYLRKIERDSAGHRIFVKEDFPWDDDRAIPFKDSIVAGVNKIVRENNKCTHVEGANYSVSKSTAREPVFYVMCKTTNSESFNVFFSEEDLTNGTQFATKENIDKQQALRLCSSYAKSSLVHPSTFRTAGVGRIVEDPNNGRTSIELVFSGRNAFNLKLKFIASCIVDASGIVEAQVFETG